MAYYNSTVDKRAFMLEVVIKDHHPDNDIIELL